MPMPTLVVEIDWTSNPLDLPSNWTDVTSRVRGFSFNYGRQRELDRTEVGSGTIVFKNLDRALDPSHTGSPYYPNVVPMRHVRIQATHHGTTYAVARGFIRSFPQTWPGKVGAEVAVEFEDAFSVLARTDLTAYSAEVLADNPLAYWRHRESLGTTALDEAGNSAGPFNGTYTAGVTLGAAGPLYGGSTAVDVNGSTGYVDAGAPVPLRLTGPMTAEAWVRADTSPGLASIAGYADESITPVQLAFFLFSVNAGYPTLQWGANSTFQSVSASSSIGTGSWHHVAAIRDVQVVRLYIDGQLAGSATADTSVRTGTTAKLFLGADWSGSAATHFFDGQIAHVAIYDYALSPDRISAHYAAKHDTLVAQRTDLAIGRMLDAAGWPAALRDLRVGRSTLVENTPNGPVLDWLLKAAEESEGGFLFVQPDGKITFRQRLDPFASQGTYGDGPGELGMQDLSLDYGDDQLWTVVEGTPFGGVATQVEDVTASTKYGRRWLSISGIFLNALDMWDRINALLQRFSTPRLRPESLVMRLGATSSDAAWNQALARWLTAVITVNRRPPGGGAAISMPSRIIGVSHDVGPSVWQTTFNLMSAQDTVSTDFWVLGTAGASELGQTTRLGY